MIYLNQKINKKYSTHSLGSVRLLTQIKSWDVCSDALSSVTPEHRNIWLSAITSNSNFLRRRSDWWSPTCLPFIICSPAAPSNLSILWFHLRLLCPANHCKSSSFSSNTGLQGTRGCAVSFNTYMNLIVRFLTLGKFKSFHFKEWHGFFFFFWHFIYFHPHWGEWRSP